ncbi:hypothetical protein DPMN_011375 [Dreissena polymorpha]|uniref:Uncharacterized protein n=1 Tax=Dreissena polymorpha TaxID=45954 RepID=A0A9D4N4Y2_DREPO|nr:hypothetical protein DPMN_011375 [Dreissena polymorpha]
MRHPTTGGGAAVLLSSAEEVLASTMEGNPVMKRLSGGVDSDESTRNDSRGTKRKESMAPSSCFARSAPAGNFTNADTFASRMSLTCGCAQTRLTVACDRPVLSPTSGLPAPLYTKSQQIQTAEAMAIVINSQSVTDALQQKRCYLRL